MALASKLRFSIRKPLLLFCFFFVTAKSSTFLSSSIVWHGLRADIVVVFAVVVNNSKCHISTWAVVCPFFGAHKSADKPLCAGAAADVVVAAMLPSKSVPCNPSLLLSCAPAPAYSSYSGLFSCYGILFSSYGEEGRQ